MEKEREDLEGPGDLPMVRHGPTQYVVDLQHKQFRRVGISYQCCDFASEQGREMREQSGIVVCRECQMAAIISPALDRKELRCMNCLALIVPRVRL